MKKIVFISFIISGLVFSCKTKEKKDPSTKDTQLQTIEVATVQSQNLTDQIISSGVRQVTGRVPGTGSRAFTGILISGAAFR